MHGPYDAFAALGYLLNGAKRQEPLVHPMYEHHVGLTIFACRGDVLTEERNIRSPQVFLRKSVAGPYHRTFRDACP